MLVSFVSRPLPSFLTISIVPIAFLSLQLASIDETPIGIRLMPLDGRIGGVSLSY